MSETIQLLADFDKELQAKISDAIPVWHSEVGERLPSLPSHLYVEFDNRYLIDVTGTGGSAVSRNKILLAFDPDFKGDKAEQFNNLRATYYHEAFHVVQGFVGDDAVINITALENAIYEGAATRFEAIRAGSNPGWGQYPEREKVLGWLNDIKSLPKKFDWDKWKFYDPETKERWIMYKVGSFVVDEALVRNPDLTIEDLATKPASKILALGGLN